MSLQVEITGIPEFNMQQVYAEICPLIINEMKRVLMSGNSLDNKPVPAREHTDHPFFYDTGKTLNSLSFTATEEGFTIFFSGRENELVAFYMNERFNWLITTDKSHMDSFVEKELDQIIQRKLDPK